MSPDISKIIKIIERLINMGDIAWEPMSIPNVPSEVDEAHAYRGNTRIGWAFTIAVFTKDGQSGYDGAAVSLPDGLVVHLTQELVKSMIEQAQGQLSSQVGL